MDLGIAGKRALVIGGTSGLGLASAEALAAEGVNLALSARNTDTYSGVIPCALRRQNVVLLGAQRR